jgi:hypothetical protein
LGDRGIFGCRLWSGDRSVNPSGWVGRCSFLRDVQRVFILCLGGGFGGGETCCLCEVWSRGFVSNVAWREDKYLADGRVRLWRGIIGEFTSTKYCIVISRLCRWCWFLLTSKLALNRVFFLNDF